MSVVEDLSKRRGGREARRALRSREIPRADAAVRPGMEGGQYKPLTQRDMSASTRRRSRFSKQWDLPRPFPPASKR
jgi:trimethylamine:corrinoid methyltransferase-like protein